jgi:two-component system, OmpR family, heavy metal sensor histidine kinase CusS
MKINSIRFKASVLYSSILCAILVVFSSVLFYTTYLILYRDVDERLSLKATAIADILKSYEDMRKIQTTPQDLINRLLGIEDPSRLIIENLWRSDIKALKLQEDYFHIFNIHGIPIIRSENFDKPMETVFKKQLPLSFAGTFFRDIKNAKQRLRAVNFPFSYRNRHSLVIQLATPLDSVIAILQKLMYFMAASVLFILGLTSFLGGFFARRVLKPVLNVINIADDITHSDLNLRIQETAADEEMRRLIRSFNAMIERLEKSFAHVNEFSSHVAHELKTPIAIIRGEMELALSGARDPKEYEKVLRVCLQEVDRLTRIIRDLLLQARLDYNPEVFRFEGIDLMEFVREMHEHSQILADSKKISADIKLPTIRQVQIRGDKTHLRRLFFNLINNAVKYTPEGGRIGIELSIAENRAHVAISDNGIGISEENLTKIFDKFFRVHKKGEGPASGNGLGLSIARSIARAHQGKITVQSRLNQGSVFTVTLPLS